MSPPPDQRALRTRLVGAELRFAWFNAQRTAPGSGDGIQHRINETFEILLDPSRPTSPYYNRAAARPGAALSAETLDGLPGEIVAIETTPAHVDAVVSARLIERGFVPAYQLCYLGVVPAGLQPVGHDVQRLTPADVDLFFDLLQEEGVAFPPEKRAAKRGYYCTPQFRALIVRDEQRRACGWTTMFVDGSTAFFGNSFTLPAFRRTGVHAALLAARLNEAVQLGLAAAFTDVEFGSQSHDNCERAGLRTLTVNTIWTRG
jgi:hypothetical protein